MSDAPEVTLIVQPAFDVFFGVASASDEVKAAIKSYIPFNGSVVS